MAASRAYRRGQPTRWSAFGSLAIWSSLSLLPDADVLGFRFGVEYADPWGHRGATHSLAFALVMALAAGLLAPLLRIDPVRTASFVGVVVASHGLLDALTDGGLGCALLWPFDDRRYFAAWRPIPVAPIGRRFFSERGLAVALHELLLFAPLFAYGLWRRKPSA